MKLVSTWADARASTVDRGTVGLVPTMGFLHEAHTALFDAAVAANDVTIATVFVNPLQFNNVDDFVAYPRNLDRDLDIADAAGIDTVFAPSEGEMYPTDMSTTVSTGAVATRMEGEYRPGHFDGVATVVAKLFAGLRPDTAYFGKKDAQQLAVVRTMARDLSLPVDVVGCSTLREPDGLALSSRNVRLDPARRSEATALSRGLQAAADLVAEGVVDAAALVGVVRTELDRAGVSPEYVELADQAGAMPISSVDRPCFLAVAAWIGEVRLIDNIHIDIIAGLPVPDRGVTLSSRSVLYGGS
ncbi:MAG TPA: pantoate--beta-alanine ligase [Actinobacteria bacterium]|nr:pantothenate synthetase [bacterium BMS3Bbin02]HDL41700.1 pantoate--beta-alanine ligase [Actinomycetota bacterium]